MIKQHTKTMKTHQFCSECSSDKLASTLSENNIKISKKNQDRCHHEHHPLDVAIRRT